MKEIEEQILHILLESETEDLTAPFRSMQPIDIKVAGKKRDKILSEVTIEVKCPECKGSGEFILNLWETGETTLKNITKTTICTKCKGTGKQTITLKGAIGMLQ